MKAAVVIAAAGSSSRMGEGIDKQFVLLNGFPVLGRTINCFRHLPQIRQILITVSAANFHRVTDFIQTMRLEVPWQIVIGGAERQQSVYNALQELEPEIELVLVHDGARPFVSAETIRETMESAMEHGAAILAVPVKDTIKSAGTDGRVDKTLERSCLWQIQTPQAFRRDLLLAAHAKAAGAGYLATDDASLVEWIGAEVRIVKGSYYNFKITTPEDLLLAQAVAEEKGMLFMQRVGLGYDVHQLVAERPLILGGVEVPYEKGLAGHSDADVLLHAIADALLGAAGMGDIGQHFPDSDPKYKGISSQILLQEVAQKIKAAGWRTSNVDAVVAAQEPKLASFIPQMNRTIAALLAIESDRVNVKATTTEKLGFVGRKEGIAAQAVVLIEFVTR